MAPCIASRCPDESVTLPPATSSSDAAAGGASAGSLRAFRIEREPFSAGFVDMDEEALTEGDVLVDVRFSSVNYKDALAGTGRGRILRAPTLNGGIDLAGRVLRSDHPAFVAGDEVFVCGAGLSETRDGGYATRARLPAACLRRPPEGLSLRETMAIGTAGITAAIAVQRLEDNGQSKDDGPILVTGASGGVGNFAVHLLAGLGYEVTASSGKAEAAEHLRRLGARTVIGRLETDRPPKPLERARWGGAVDSVGGRTLARVASETRSWGSIACIGLAGGAVLETTVMPLILRGVSLLGINGIELPETVLARCWERLATDLRPTRLAEIAAHTIPFDALPATFEAMLDNRIIGRTVVDVRA